MAKKGFYYNQDDCVGCKACQVACKDKNDLPIGVVFRHVRDFESGEFPSVNVYHLAQTCNHCENPACVENCPTGAMFADSEDGTVQHNDDLCIGCQTCVKSCPYSIPQYFAEEEKVRKCDACLQLRNNGELPACVAACATRCLQFGDIEELAKAHANAVKDIAPLPDSSVTSPCTLIDAKAAAANNNFAEIRL